MEICMVGINMEKLALRQNSGCCKADFWPVHRLGLSWNFKVLHWINLNDSFKHYYVHREDYVMRFKHNSVLKAQKVKTQKKVALRQVVRKQVRFQDSKEENTQKISQQRNVILNSFQTLLKINMMHLELFYSAIYHGYWKYKFWNIFTFYFNFNIQKFFSTHGGYLLNTTL